MRKHGASVLERPFPRNRSEQATVATALRSGIVALVLGDFGQSLLILSMMTKSSDRQRHQRWMLLASLNLVSAAVVRWPFEFVAADLPVPYYTMTDAILCFWPLRSLGTCIRRAACIA